MASGVREVRGCFSSVSNLRSWVRDTVPAAWQAQPDGTMRCQNRLTFFYKGTVPDGTVCRRRQLFIMLITKRFIHQDRTCTFVKAVHFIKKCPVRGKTLIKRGYSTSFS